MDSESTKYYKHKIVRCYGPVSFAEKTSRNTVPADLLGEKNIVPAEKDGLEEKRTWPI